MVICRVKPFQLIDRESIKDSNSKKVMLEDGLEDVKNLLDQEDLEGDTIGVKYLRMANTVSFSEMCTYTIELPVSQFGTPEVKSAKRTEIKNLMDYKTFEEVKDKGQETIGSRWIITQKE